MSGSQSLLLNLTNRPTPLDALRAGEDRARDTEFTRFMMTERKMSAKHDEFLRGREKVNAQKEDYIFDQQLQAEAGRQLAAASEAERQEGLRTARMTLSVNNREDWLRLKEMNPIDLGNQSFRDAQLGARALLAAAGELPEPKQPLSTIGKRNADVQAGFATQEQVDAANAPKPQPDKSFDHTAKLRDEFTKGAQDFVKVRDAFGRIQASAADPSAAGDLALLFNYMKVLDPGSTVREGEFATAQNAGGVDDRISSLYNSVINGTRLTADQRADFLNRSQRLFSQQLAFQQARTNEFTRLAESFGLDPSQVIVDLTSGLDTLDTSSSENLSNIPTEQLEAMAAQLRQQQ